MSSKTRVVIVGGGMAAARLAQHLGGAAALGQGLAVTVIGEEPHAAYNRVLLAEVLAGQYAPEVIALPRPAEGVTWLSGVRVVRIDRALHAGHGGSGGRVVCDDGRVVAYDVLVLATGSNPVLPPLHGMFPPGGGDLPEGVHAFRTLDDCTALDEAVRGGARQAVVIGGGLLGVSAARALAERGARVVLAHQGEHLMERHLDAGASALLRAHLTELGVETHTECRVRGLRTSASPAAMAAGTARGLPDGAPPRAPGLADGRGAGLNPAAGSRRVTGVELADRFLLDAELVVLACGVRPRTGLARATGLALGARGGVLVDDRLRSSDPGVYALGDCAEHDGVLYGLAGAAQEQADVLARVLLAGGGDSRSPRYAGTRALVRLTLGGGGAPLDIAAFGDTTPAPGDDVVQLADATRGAYRKIVVRGDRLRGGILLGDLGSVGTLARTWEGDEPLPATAPLLHLLTHDAHHGGM
jgi:assimilatory nitrate reductase electron transfer subunit